MLKLKERVWDESSDFKKFHSYRSTLVVETDHKALIALMKNNLSEMSQRIQRLMMKLQHYDFNLIHTHQYKQT